jgi:hypothetical protein
MLTSHATARLFKSFCERFKNIRPATFKPKMTVAHLNVQGATAVLRAMDQFNENDRSTRQESLEAGELPFKILLHGG